MKLIGSPPRESAQWDVPASKLAADVAELVERQRRQREVEADVVRKAAARTHSESDRIAYALDARMVIHPELPVATDADYANTPWAAWLAAQIKKNQTAGGTS